ncbi:S53 family peptidase [Nocardioides mangrovicus]|uniref:S53 family peptidase n=1 Tax=Nocardioides mangrovicus TaxID=2478913 RepID=UPI001313E580|nr:S53 family peptidase [Nocardioides mangrovicus]
MPHSRPGWVARSHSLGKPAASKQTTLKVYLAPHGGLAALKDDVAAVSTPGNARYGKFLSASQYHATYDPTSAEVKAVKTYLKDQHVTTTGVAAHHAYLTVRGTNAHISKAFGVSLAKFQHQGQAVQANTDAVTLPGTIASSVLTVTGLDTTKTKIQHLSSTPAPPPAGFNNARPCSTFYGQVLATKQADYKTPLPKFNGKSLPYAVCGYTGPQLRAAYQGANPSGLDGSGVTVGILDAYASPTIAQDAQTYATNHGDGSYAKNQLTQVTPSAYTNQADCDPSGWFGEETLDVEAVHAMAPGSKVRYYAAASCYDDDFLNGLTKIVNQNKVQVVSNSWGEPDEGENGDALAAYQEVFMQASMQGISVLFSSGDNGDELANTAIKQTDSPASSPYVTAVGGTAAGIGSDGSMTFQTGWGTQKYSLSASGQAWTPVGYLYGAGGGTSSLFNQPSYQKGVVPSSQANGRAVPDVAMDADPTTGMLVGETQTFTDGVRYGEYRIGGTSLASPLFAGQTALMLQNSGGKSAGLLNPLLYKQLNKAAYVDDVSGPGPDAGNVRVDYSNGENASDGLLYSIRTFNQDSSLTVTKGWDNVTGVGSPNAGYINYKLK